MPAKRLFTFIFAAIAACWLAQANAERELPHATYDPSSLSAACRLAGGVFSPVGDNPGGGFYCLFPDGTLISCGPDNQCTVDAFVPTIENLWKRSFLIGKAVLDKRADGPADLVPLPPPASTLPFGLCKRNDQGQLLLQVYNQGGAGADASTTRLMFGNVPVDIATPALAGRSGTQLVVNIPSACFDANNECRFTVGVDALNVVAESNETNNDLAGACGPQFQ
jgi:hypothetical protein